MKPGLKYQLNRVIGLGEHGVEAVMQAMKLRVALDGHTIADFAQDNNIDVYIHRLLNDFFNNKGCETCLHNDVCGTKELVDQLLIKRVKARFECKYWIAIQAGGA